MSNYKFYNHHTLRLSSYLSVLSKIYCMGNDLIQEMENILMFDTIILSLKPDEMDIFQIIYGFVEEAACYIDLNLLRTYANYSIMSWAVDIVDYSAGTTLEEELMREKPSFERLQMLEQIVTFLGDLSDQSQNIVMTAIKKNSWKISSGDEILRVLDRERSKAKYNADRLHQEE